MADTGYKQDSIRSLAGYIGMTQQQQPLRAIALHYDGDNAPTVMASGEGDIAAEIIRIAKQHNIPLREDAALTEMLKDMQLGEAIPETLYRVIAEVIAYAYIVSGKFPKQKG